MVELLRFNYILVILPGYKPLKKLFPETLSIIILLDNVVSVDIIKLSILSKFFGFWTLLIAKLNNVSA